jgi:uncharacterized protein DUF2793
MTDLVTSRLALPLLAAGQAQKEMAHNEALARLDLAVQGAAIAAGLDIPPEAPLAGQCWIVGDAPEGAWAGQSKAVAGWTEGGWRFVAPAEGMRLWLGRNEGFALFSGGNWQLGEAHGRLFIGGVQVVGPRAAAIMEPSGGAVVDAEARASILAVLDVMRAHGLVDTD